MPEIDYTGRAGEIDQLTSYINEYCEARGIDPEQYTAYLDGNRALDPAIFEDPGFQAYWQVSYLQLVEILDPPLIQSVYAQVGDVNFDEVYSRADPEFNEFLENLIMDSPELLAFAAAEDGTISEDAVWQFLEEETASPYDTDYVDEQARALQEEFGLGGMWDHLINTEEGILSLENALVMTLTELDQGLEALRQSLAEGTISEDEFSAEFQMNSAYRGTILGLIQSLDDTLSNQLEMFSELIESEDNLQLAIARNLSISS